MLSCAPAQFALLELKWAMPIICHAQGREGFHSNRHSDHPRSTDTTVVIKGQHFPCSFNQFGFFTARLVRPYSKKPRSWSKEVATFSEVDFVCFFIHFNTGGPLEIWPHGTLKNKKLEEKIIYFKVRALLCANQPCWPYCSQARLEWQTCSTFTMEKAFPDCKGRSKICHKIAQQSKCLKLSLNRSKPAPVCLTFPMWALCKRIILIYNLMWSGKSLLLYEI